MNSVLIKNLIFSLLYFAGVHAAEAQTITVGGVGSITALMRILGAQFCLQNPGVQVVIVRPPMGANGSMRALKAGMLDLALLGRKPSAADMEQITIWTQTPQLPLSHAPSPAQIVSWLKTPLVLATSVLSTVGVSRSQVADLYAGRKITWDNGAPVRLVLRGAGVAETLSLRSMSADIASAVEASLKRLDLAFPEDDITALEVLGNIRGSFGATSLGMITSNGAPIGALAIDGKYPSIKALESGDYPWAIEYYLVNKANPSPGIVAFIAYLQSPAALALARKLDYLAAEP